jgi:tetratricopeptide (TPR) repeat protein
MRRLVVLGGTLAWLLAAAGYSTAAVPLYTGLGTLHHAVTTRSPAAQQYFDQGLKLCYAFNHDEAIRAFREAARLDPSCAMAHWGIAMALGPNVNLPVDPEREKEAFTEVQKARALGSKATARERAWINALAKRYSDDPKADLKALDAAFADAMRGLSAAYPDDLDAATIYAEALLDVHPWDWWSHDGKPQAGTQDAIAALTKVLRKNPNHIGANHLYIHAIEESPAPGRALLAANRLARLAPNAGHLVHMPSHIYLRVGRYHDAAELNRKAIAVDRAYIEAQKPQGIYPMMYYVHNMHMAWAAMSIEGRSKEAIRMARTVADHVSPDAVRGMPPMEFWLPVPYFALARFAKWDEILSEPAPPLDLRYTTGMWHFARGMAFAATGKPDAASAERDSVAAIAAATPADAMAGLNSSAALLKLAADVLNGECALRAGRWEEAVRSFQTSVSQEDSLHYDEPPAWYYPVRQSLGLALLKAGKPAEAETAYRADLKRYPENGWSLYGLAEALNARGRVTESLAVKKRFTRAWTRADVKISSSVL